MISFKAKDKNEFFKIFMEIQSMQYKFNSREIELGSEFLMFKYKYLKDPLRVTIIEERNGDKEEVLHTPTMIEQLKDIRTLTQIKKNLNMSNSILRKHVTGLKDKGFFVNGEINSSFETDGNLITFHLTI